MRVAVAQGADGGGLLQAVAEDGAPAGPVERVPDLAAAIGEWERDQRPRWVWAATGELYPRLLAAGARVDRCADLRLTEGILLAADGRWGEPRSFPAAWARLEGRPVPDDSEGRWDGQPALFDHGLLGLPSDAEVLAGWVGRATERGQGSGLGLLVAAEAAGALAAVEMAAAGLPWRPEVHDAVLTELLGPRPQAGTAPERLRDLAAR